MKIESISAALSADHLSQPTLPTVTKPQTPPNRITIETSDGSFEIAADDNLLDALIDNNYEIDYQCRGGYCGACRTTLVSGEVDYDEHPLAHLAHDEILPCCCRIRSCVKLAVKKRRNDNHQQAELFDS